MNAFLSANLSILRFLAQLRNPLTNALAQMITELGSESILILVPLIVFWCVDKRRGLYLIAVGMFGTVFNQVLKFIFRIPRPWVLDPSFEIVESARADATGWSFPSGHTQNASCIFGGAAATSRRKSSRILCTAIVLLVAYSRMHLGVHTPLDVLTSLALGVAAVFLFTWLYQSPDRFDRLLIPVFSALAAVSLVFVFSTLYVRSHAVSDLENYDNAIKNFWTLFGVNSGLILSTWADRKWFDFSTSAPLPAQIVKVLGGFAVMLLIRIALKPLLSPIPFGAGPGVRYFILILVASTVWPMTFSRISALFFKREAA